jgi:hypothetical protein
VTSDDPLTPTEPTALLSAIHSSSPRFTEDAAHLEAALDTMVEPHRIAHGSETFG